MSKRVFAVFLKHGGENFKKAIDPAFIAIVKLNGGSSVLSGYDMSKFLACLVFDTKEQRDRVSQFCEQNNIEIETRDDGYID